METTEAWVLHGDQAATRDLCLERMSFDLSLDDECLVEPLYGSWEGNMIHAVERSPIDICRTRNEARVVVGNAGVVRVLRAGPGAAVSEGDLCIHNGRGAEDRFGLLQRAFAYDAPGTIGFLAKRT